MLSVNKLLPDVNPSVPRMGNPVTRFLGRSLLRLLGWRVRGELPEQKKLILIAAPHTSNWDFVTAMAGVCATGVKWSYMMKKEAFIFPLKSFFLKIGGIPIDRNQTEGLVEQVADAFKKKDKLWLAMTPDGTRGKAYEYKTGFLRIAQLAEVPILVIGWNYPTKEIVLDHIWNTTGDHVQDAADIRAYINKHYTGRHPENQ